MSKLNSTLKVTEQYSKPDLYRILTDIDKQVNGLSEGKIYANYGARPTEPTSSAVPAACGDKVWKTGTTVQGTVGSQYVLIGWICTTSGSPGIWAQMRCLTGT